MAHDRPEDTDQSCFLSVDIAHNLLAHSSHYNRPVTPRYPPEAVARNAPLLDAGLMPDDSMKAAGTKEGTLDRKVLDSVHSVHNTDGAGDNKENSFLCPYPSLCLFRMNW